MYIVMSGRVGRGYREADVGGAEVSPPSKPAEPSSSLVLGRLGSLGGGQAGSSSNGSIGGRSGPGKTGLPPHLLSPGSSLLVPDLGILDGLLLLPLLVLLGDNPDCDSRVSHMYSSWRYGEKGVSLTRLVRLGVLLELGDKLIKLLLASRAPLEAPPAQVGVVFGADLVLGGRNVGRQHGAADTSYQATVSMTFVSLQKFHGHVVSLVVTLQGATEDERGRRTLRWSCPTGSSWSVSCPWLEEVEGIGALGAVCVAVAVSAGGGFGSRFRGEGGMRRGGCRDVEMSGFLAMISSGLSQGPWLVETYVAGGPFATRMWLVQRHRPVCTCI